MRHVHQHVQQLTRAQKNAARDAMRYAMGEQVWQGITALNYPLPKHVFLSTKIMKKVILIQQIILEKFA